MEVVPIAMHSKNSLDFSDKQLGFITFQPKCCNCLDFQVNIQLTSANYTKHASCNCLDFQVNIQRYDGSGRAGKCCNCLDFQVLFF